MWIKRFQLFTFHSNNNLILVIAKAAYFLCFQQPADLQQRDVYRQIPHMHVMTTLVIR